jgi:hypothetical protein
MQYKYKHVETRTKAGHARAVKLQAAGWEVITGSLYGAVILEKAKTPKNAKK